MAEEKIPEQEQPKANVDVLRQLTIPLRRELLKVPRYDRTKKAVKATRNFLQKHMKSTDVLLGDSLNKELHKGGMKNPPTKVKVKVYKYQDQLMADTIDAPFKMETKKEEKKGIAEKVKGLIKKDKPEENAPTAKEKPKEEIKKETSKPKKAAEPKKENAAVKKK